MSVDNDALCLAQLRGDDVRRLARDSGQAHEFLETARHAAVELLDQHLHRPADRLRLLTEEPRGPDVVLELLGRHREVVLRPAVLAEESGRDAVDVDVGRLRGEHHRDQQLELVPKAKCDCGVLVLGCEALDDGDDPGALRPHSPPRLGDETTH